ncbi:MAG: 7-cyano-7-deazaguanine synthase QueC [Fimbriimonadaceae bacterium]|nr:7-cyano-7-deazaguanine synthase QueC [Fimbriimonadaceae bacterium]
MPLAVVAMSGGLDSCVTAALALHAGEQLAALHVSYGQLTARREHQAFEAVCDALGIRLRHHASIAHLREFGGSALTDPTLALPLGEDPHRAGIPVSYVPQRNGNLLLIAAAWAEVLHAESIWTGMVEEDASGYPDCRRSFCDALERAIGEGNHDDHPDPRIVTPLIHLTKGQIVAQGLALGAPLELTWSCYQREDRACGVCDSCQLRLQGFAANGASDPLPYLER